MQMHEQEGRYITQYVFIQWNTTRGKKVSNQNNINYWHQLQHRNLIDMKWSGKSRHQSVHTVGPKDDVSGLTFQAFPPYLVLPIPLTLKLHSGFSWPHAALDIHFFSVSPGVLFFTLSFQVLCLRVLQGALLSSTEASFLECPSLQSQMTLRCCFPSGQGYPVTCLPGSWLWTFSEQFQFREFKINPRFCPQTWNSFFVCFLSF